MLKNGDMLGNRYVVETLLARGGMGAVYKVQDSKLRSKIWAVKEMFEVQIGHDIFLDEVRILSELSHPYIPKIVDYLEPSESGSAFLVMEYIQGSTLQDHYQGKGYKLPLEKTVKYAIQLCEVLTYLHEQPKPLIFRDLKPANVMVDEYDNVKLIDFGIARSFKYGQQTDTIALGTVAFASPEQLENKQTDVRSDLYSLGATLYYLVSAGKYFYSSQTVANELNLTESKALNRIIKQLLEGKPENRFQDARMVKQQLEGVLAEITEAHKRMLDDTVLLNGNRSDDYVSMESRKGDVSVQEDKKRNPYSVQATNSTPALIIYLLDVSGSMSLELEGKRRIDVVRHALNAAIKQMIFRSTKGSRISSRYRLAILSYSGEVYDMLGGVKSIEEFAQTGILPDLTPMKFTDAAKAFEYAEKILQEELPRMQNCPAPLICHMTDGTHTGEDPEPIAKRIMEMSVLDGHVLVENIFISDSILNEPIENAKSWKGITDETTFTNEVATKLRNMSSPLPESYREMMLESSYSLQPGSRMMLPGTSSELVSLGFQMSAATPVLK